MLRTTVAGLLLCCTAATGCGSGSPGAGPSTRPATGGHDLPSPPSSPSDPASVPAGSVVVRFGAAPPLVVEVVSTPERRQVGLMNRTSVPEGTGMLFLYPRPVKVGFWMKNTLVPLSIAYVDGDRVVSTAEMTPCRADDCPVYPPAGSYTFAVEARAGFFPDHDVRAGTTVRVEGALPAAR